jgi:hypothetical protein
MLTAMGVERGPPGSTGGAERGVRLIARCDLAAQCIVLDFARKSAFIRFSVISKLLYRHNLHALAGVVRSSFFIGVRNCWPLVELSFGGRSVS